MSYISSLPPELLSECFIYAAQSDYLSPPLPLPVEILVSHVSSRWQRIAFSTPELWTTIQASPRNHLDKIAAYLLRSSPFPIHVIYDYVGDGRQEYFAGIIAMAKIHPHLGRCLSLRIRTSEETMLVAFDHIVPLFMPLLHSLSIAVVDSSFLDRHPSFAPSIFLGGAPQLSLIHLAGCRALMHCYPPVSQLTTLHFHQSYSDTDYPSLTYECFRAIISETPLLKMLSIHGELIVQWPTEAQLASAADPSSLFVHAPSLYTLSMKFIPIHSSLFTLFIVLVAPQLRDVTLISIGDTDIDAISSYQHRSPPLTIHGLTLQAPRLTLRMLPKFTHLFPHVKHLCCFGQMTMDMQICLSKRWLELHTIELSGHHPDYNPSLAGRCLSSILDARKDAGKPIRLVRLQHSSIVSPEDLESLRTRTKVEVADDILLGRRSWWEMMQVMPWWIAQDTGVDQAWIIE